MSIEDRGEDIEEEEEFHEIRDAEVVIVLDDIKKEIEEIEKKEIAQAAEVQADAAPVVAEATPVAPEATPVEVAADAPVQSPSEPPKTVTKNADWADMMLSTQKEEQTQGEEDSSKLISEQKELDLDEDVKNPQYIPKKGVFYEHDDRTHGATSNNNNKQQSTSAKKDDDTTDNKSVEPSSGKKTTTSERQGDNRRGNRRQRSDNDRWDHDRFRYDQQKPKNKSDHPDHSHDGKQDRAPRNNQSENRPSKSMNNGNDKAERPQGSQDNQQRSRQNKSGRNRQGQTANRSGDRFARRQDNNRVRTDSSGAQNSRREPQNRRSGRSDVTSKGMKSEQQPIDVGTQNNVAQNSSNSSPSAFRREQANRDGSVDKGSRSDNRGFRRQTGANATPGVVDDKFPPINTIMPPMTTWSNKIEDMVKEETTRKVSPPSRQHGGGLGNITGNASTGSKARNETGWGQNPIQRNNHQDRVLKNSEDPRQQQQQQQYIYQPRKLQERGDDSFKQAQFTNRNHYLSDRQNQHPQDWRRTGHYAPHMGKSNDYGPVRTQTFENSRLAHANSMNRSQPRDAREIIDRRIQQQQQQQQQHNFQSKISPDQHLQQPRSLEQLQQQQQPQHQLMQHPHQPQHPHMIHHQQHRPHHVQQHVRSHQPQQVGPILQHQVGSSNQGAQQQATQQQPPSQQQLSSGHRQHQSSTDTHTSQPRQGIVLNNIIDNNHNRLNAGVANSNDMINTRPIVKAETFTGANISSPAGHASQLHHQQQQQQIQSHSQNHRSLGSAGGPLSQQPGPATGASHLVPSHLEGSGTPAQYYAPTGTSRDPDAAASMAGPYHGYMPGGHSVMDTSRYHMGSQHVSDHGYMASAGQGNDVPGSGSVMHQQEMYNDATAAGGTVASSAYLAQAGSTLSPSANIPVTGSGPPPPMAPVSYMQHSQYAPPPYSNPYSQQPNQAPPPQQSSHAYPYHWTYI